MQVVLITLNLKILMSHKSTIYLVNGHFLRFEIP